MVRRLVFVCALAGALVLPVGAQDGEETPPPPAGGQEGGQEEGGQRRGRQGRGGGRTLRKLDTGTLPAEWTARPAEPQQQGGRRFQGDWNLPAADGQSEGPRVTVLATGAQQREFETYRERLRGTWTKADGSALSAEDQTVETRKEGELEVRLVTQAGTQTPRGGAAKSGQKLVAAWIKAGNDSWSVWLLGPAEGVDKHREAFLAWLDQVKPGPAPAGRQRPEEGQKPEGGQKPEEGGQDEGQKQLGGGPY